MEECTKRLIFSNFSVPTIKEKSIVSSCKKTKGSIKKEKPSKKCSSQSNKVSKILGKIHTISTAPLKEINSSEYLLVNGG